MHTWPNFAFTVAYTGSGGALSLTPLAGAIAFTGYAPTVASSGVVITPSVTVSRSSGKELLAVYFDASGTTASTTSDPEHELFYAWDFGDERGQTWAYGTNTTQSKNAAYGPQAAHVYTTAGTFTPTCVILDGSGNTTTWTGSSITVSAWTDAESIYLDTAATPTPGAGDVPAGVPSGNCHQVSTWAQVLGYVANGKRVRVKKGTTFSVGSTTYLSANTATAQLDSYGSTGAAPTVTTTAGCVLVSLESRTCSDIRIANLKLVGGVEGALYACGIHTNTATSALIHGCEISGSLEGIDTFANTGLCISECNIHDIGAGYTTWVNGNQYYGAYLDECYNMAIIGSTVNIVETGHGVRVPGCNKGVIANNTFNGARHGAGGGSGHVFTLRGFTNNTNLPTSYGTFSGVYTEKIVIRDNVFSSPYDAVSLLQVEPQGDYDASRLRNVLIECNYFEAVLSVNPIWLSTTTNTTFRNNIIKTATANYGLLIRASSDVAGEPSTSDLKVYNNTFYQTGSQAGYVLATLETESGATAISGVVIKNNLGYAPSSSGAAKVNGSGYTESNNSSNAQIQGTKPWAATVPATYAQYAPNGYGVNGGASVPVVKDFFNTTITGTREIGAVQV